MYGDVKVSVDFVNKLIEEKLKEAYQNGFENGRKQKEYDLLQDGKLEEEYKKGYEQGVKDERKRIYGLIDAFADSQNEEGEGGDENGLDTEMD